MKTSYHWLPRWRVYSLEVNFERILQAHDQPIRSMAWSNGCMVSGYDGGTIKYYKNNMSNVKANRTAHKESIRDLKAGHGWDVKSVDWHPTKSLLVSGRRDQFVKLWDARTGKELCSLHGHKNMVLSVKWNQNGNWLLTASKDQIIKAV